MPAGNQQHHIGKADAICQAWGQRMSRQMVNPHQRQSGPGSDTLGRHYPGHHPTDQPRASRHRHAVQIAQGKPALFQCLLDTKIQLFRMCPCRDFGHHAAEIGVQCRLPGHDRGQNPAIAGNDRGGCIVTAAFYAKENQIAHALAGWERGDYACLGITARGKMPMPPATSPATVLLTRPLEDSRRFAAMLPGARVLISPVLRIETVPHDAARLQAAPGLVFTSAHAVAAAGAGCGRLALCVGPRTASVARDAGFAVTAGPGDAEGMLRLIEAVDVPLIYPRGRHVAQALPVEDMVVYDQVSQSLSGRARTLLAGNHPVVLPLFSHRSAELLSCAMPADVRAPAWLVAISDAALAGWGGGYELVQIADHPRADSMRDAIMGLLLREQ